MKEKGTRFAVFIALHLVDSRHGEQAAQLQSGQIFRFVGRRQIQARFAGGVLGIDQQAHFPLFPGHGQQSPLRFRQHAFPIHIHRMHPRQFPGEGFCAGGYAAVGSLSQEKPSSLIAREAHHFHPVSGLKHVLLLAQGEDAAIAILQV